MYVCIFKCARLTQSPTKKTSGAVNCLGHISAQPVYGWSIQTGTAAANNSGATETTPPGAEAVGRCLAFNQLPKSVIPLQPPHVSSSPPTPPPGRQKPHPHTRSVLTGSFAEEGLCRSESLPKRTSSKTRRNSP